VIEKPIEAAESRKSLSAVIYRDFGDEAGELLMKIVSRCREAGVRCTLAEAVEATKGSRMKRIVVLTLVMVLSAGWPTPAKAQGTGAAEYGRQTWIEAKKQEKINKKAGKKLRKDMNKNAKAQRKAAKKANSHAR